VRYVGPLTIVVRPPLARLAAHARGFGFTST
jgi:hypothetical protein